MKAMRLAQLAKLMLEGKYSMAELSRMTGLSRDLVNEYCACLHEVGAAHIRDWGPDAMGRHSVRIFKLGKGRDRKKPAAMSDAQRQANRKMRAQLKMQEALCSPMQSAA